MGTSLNLEPRSIRITIASSRFMATVLLTNPDGTVTEGTGLGLFDDDTRIMSRYRLLIDGEQPRCGTAADVESRTRISQNPEIFGIWHSTFVIDTVFTSL